MGWPTDHHLVALRHICWERAKGELWAMTHTYSDDEAEESEIRFQVEKAIEKIEEALRSEWESGR